MSSYIKRRFAQCKCRTCLKTFCCETCRFNHEKLAHDYLSDCDICNYGCIRQSLLTFEILKHIRYTHWPIHCVNCHKLFKTVVQLDQHHLCVAKVQKTPIRPAIMVTTEEADNFCSPPVLALLNLEPSTSTPLQGADFLQIAFSETITPVDNVERKGPMGNIEGQKQGERRVTFNGTPQFEGQRRKDCMEVKGLKLEPISSEEINFSEDSNAPETDKTTNNYVTAENGDGIDLEENRKRRSSGMSDLWQSAINESLEPEYEQQNEKNECNDVQIKQEVQEIKVEETAMDETTPTAASCDFNSRLIEDACDSTRNPKSENLNGIWSSMALIVKNAMQNFGKGNPKPKPRSSLKRCHSDPDINDANFQRLKKIKLCDIKCRPPIRYITRRRSLKKRITKATKATQTDPADYM